MGKAAHPANPIVVINLLIGNVDCAHDRIRVYVIIVCVSSHTYIKVRVMTNWVSSRTYRPVMSNCHQGGVGVGSSEMDTNFILLEIKVVKQSNTSLYF